MWWFHKYYFCLVKTSLIGRLCVWMQCITSDYRYILRNTVLKLISHSAFSEHITMRCTAHYCSSVISFTFRSTRIYSKSTPNTLKSSPAVRMRDVNSTGQSEPPAALSICYLSQNIKPVGDCKISGQLSYCLLFLFCLHDRKATRATNFSHAKNPIASS